MNKNIALPKLIKKKKINHKKFVTLAKKVRESLEEEERYLEEKVKHDEDSLTRGFLLNS